MSRFENALKNAKSNMAFEGSIGTLSEKTMHSFLKYYLEPCDDFHEVAVGRYIADIMRAAALPRYKRAALTACAQSLRLFSPNTP